MSRTPFVHVDRLPDVGTVPLSELVQHHLRRVLRLADGARVTVSDGAGRVGDGRLEGATVVLDGPATLAAPPSPRVVLVQAVPKGRAFDEAVRLAVEVGVDDIVPLVAERGVARPDASGGRALVERARAVAVAAAGQARRAHVPTVAEPQDLDGVLAAIGPGDLVLVGAPGGPGPREVLPGPGEAPQRVVVIVGPEGGLSADELERAERHGARRLGLGASVLRSEHAGLALVAVAAAWLGRMERTAEDPEVGATWR